MGFQEVATRPEHAAVPCRLSHRFVGNLGVGLRRQHRTRASGLWRLSHGSVGVLICVYVLGLKQLRGRFSTATVMSWNLGISTCVLLLAAIVAGEALLPPSIYGWGILIAFAVIVDVTARTSYTYSFARLTASFTAVGMLVVPGMAALIAWILFGETLSWLQIVAGLPALAGVGLARHGQKGG